MDIVEAIRDTNLFGPLFKNVGSWANWIVVLKAVFALEMDNDERRVFTHLTGRESPPTAPVSEAWLIIGRRGGKSRIAALIAVYLACFKDYRPYVSPGEKVVILVMACDRKQARVIFRFCVAFLESVDMLAALIERRNEQCIELSNGVNLEITTNDFRSVRGQTVAALIADEIAFWRSDDSANPDVEVLNAVRPAMSTIPTSLLISLGSPYRRAGAMYDAYKRYYAQDHPHVLVVQADTRTMNPSISQRVVDQAMENDPAAALSEWYANFRSDIGSFLDLDLIDRAVETGRQQRYSLRGIEYVAFADPSGGSNDSFSLCIGHVEGERQLIDCLEVRKPPFSPAEVVKYFCAVLRAYGCSQLVGDKYAGAWVTESFQRHGIQYRHADLNKSELYLESLPCFTAGTVALLDHPVLVKELSQLERRTSRMRRDIIDHPPGCHDDLANSACGCVALLTSLSMQGAVMVKVTGW